MREVRGLNLENIGSGGAGSGYMLMELQLSAYDSERFRRLSCPSEVRRGFWSFYPLPLIIVSPHTGSWYERKSVFTSQLIKLFTSSAFKICFSYEFEGI